MFYKEPRFRVPLQSEHPLHRKRGG